MSSVQSMPSKTLHTVTEIFHLYDPPLWLVTAHAGERRGGFIATSVVRASIVTEIPRILMAVAKHHYTWNLIDTSGQFALHLLTKDDLEAVWRFGLASGHQGDKFSGLDIERTPAGHPLYPHGLSWMDCRIEARMDIGDRTVLLAEIMDAGLSGSLPPLTVGALLKDAPPERKAELKRLYARDQSMDAAAIRAWRIDLARG